MPTLFQTIRLTVLALLVAFGGAVGARAQTGGPLEITVDGANFEPIAFAAPAFLGGDARAQEIGAQIGQVISANLTGSGLFREVPRAAHIQQIAEFDAPPAYADWKAINADALITGRASFEADGRLLVQFRLFDSFAETQIEGLQYFVDAGNWRRVAHKIADAVYTALTGEEGYFDTRVVFVDESGPKDARVKRLAVMDQDGANVRYLTNGGSLVLTPRFSPTDQDVLYISYERGSPQVFLINLDTGQREALGQFPGMSFAPRFSPDGRRVVMSLEQGGNTDIWVMELATRQMTRLTQSSAIETAPSFSPDGARIAFESDRGGGQQIYVMGAGGGGAQRISFGGGQYGTPVWSPRGDQIAFTKMEGGVFKVGVMRVDGSEERILDESFLSEGPTWAPNGRVLMFFREGAGARGAASIWSVDVTGANLKRAPTPGAASDPAWSPRLP